MIKGVAALGLLSVLLLSFYNQDTDFTSSDAAALHTEYGTVQLEVADTVTEQRRGLSGRTEIRSNEGMLFVFSIEGDHGFWMKEMNFPIDIIWLDSDFRVVHILEAVEPSTYPETFHSPYPSQYVLELESLRTKSLNIKVGDRLDIKTDSI